MQKGEEVKMRKLTNLLKTGFVMAVILSAGEAFAQDIEAGQAAFRKCAVCHSIVEGQNKIGPSLFGVLGRTPGTTNFKYSNAMTAYGEAVIVILAVGFPVHRIALGVMVPLGEITLVTQYFSDHIAFGLCQHTIAFQHLGTGLVHGNQLVLGLL